MVNDLWPEDIYAEEVLSPAEILESQATLLNQKTNGLLTGSVESHEGEDRRILAFEVSASVLDTKVRLFEVHQHLEMDYPAAIVLPDQNLPEFLRKERYSPAPFEMLKAVGNMTFPKQGKWVENEWVATSPPEFSEKIAEALDHPFVKGRVLSLISRSQAALRRKKVNGDNSPAQNDNPDTNKGECPEN